MLLRKKPNTGKHFNKAGHLVGEDGIPFDDDTNNLHLKFPDKFEVVHGASNIKEARQQMHPCGEDISEKHTTACEAISELYGKEAKVQIFVKNRRYRIVINEDIQDTEPAKIMNARQLSKALKTLTDELKLANENQETEETEEEEEGTTEDE